MKPLTLQSTAQPVYTCVPNSFLDIYMPKTSGEFVKIYLYILRCLAGGAVTDNCLTYRSGCLTYSGSDDCFCVSFLADKLNLTENDVMRALKYWEKEGLLILTYSEAEQESELNAKRELTGITVVIDYPVSNEAGAGSASHDISADRRPADNAKPVSSDKKPRYTSAQLKKFSADDELRQLLYIAQKYLGKTLTASETNLILFFYDTLKMPSDMIEYLLEYCISQGHKNLRYMEKVAVDWIEKGLTTVDEAKQYSSSQTNEAFAVLNAFGITGRGIAGIERDYIRKWSDTYCFGSDIIVEACNRTIQAIHQPSFEYADTILSNWKEQGIQNISDIKALDEKFEAARKASAKSKTRIPASGQQRNREKQTPPNRFNNFSQRSYDYDELEKNFSGKGLV